MGGDPPVEGVMSWSQRRRERSTRRRELMDLARWMETRFHLGAKPKIYRPTDAEVIYAEVLKRLASLADNTAEASCEKP